MFAKVNLKTFDNAKKRLMKKSSNSEIACKNDNNLFGHMPLIASSSKLDIKVVLEHLLWPPPWLFANDVSTLRKTNKQPLARKLKTNAFPTEEIPRLSSCIIDGISLI